MIKEEKQKALDAALAQIEKAYGKGSVMKLGDPSAKMNVETIPTGSLSLILPYVLAAFPRAVLSKSMVLNPVVKPPWLFTW